MRIPFDAVADAFKMGVSAQQQSDEPVRVSVYVDGSASAYLIDAIRSAMVPQTIGGLVRVSRLTAELEPKADSDLAIVVSCGSSMLEAACHRLVISGSPTVVVCESRDDAPFIERDTPMLGLVASREEGVLLHRLACWVLDRTDKPQAFAANFPFMRATASRGVVAATALSNAVTGALTIVPGADFPVMTLAQLGMMAKLASMYDKPMRFERLYDAAGVAVAGLGLRALSRSLAPRAGRAAFAVKASIGGLGTIAMGIALMELYARDIDYGPANRVVRNAVDAVRDAVAPADGVASVSAEYLD